MVLVLKKSVTLEQVASLEQSSTIINSKLSLLIVWDSMLSKQSVIYGSRLNVGIIMLNRGSIVINLRFLDAFIQAQGNDCPLDQ